MSKRVVAVCHISNTASVNIYDIRYGIVDEVLAGINNDSPEWYEINDDLFFDITECIRVN